MSKPEERIHEMKTWVEHQLTPEHLKKIRRMFYPAGSGSLGCGAMVCALVDLLAREKGWNLDEVRETE